MLVGVLASLTLCLVLFLFICLLASVGVLHFVSFHLSPDIGGRVRRAVLSLPLSLICLPTLYSAFPPSGTFVSFCAALFFPQHGWLPSFVS